ncbi:TonB-dependent receptor [uncultured Aquimarina sp.]|uniref:TonB-dependent receptor n=1 Tax=uncultured Aquimarina sp. TaxID=575652 RepID=UPI00261D06E8|nr:TonB-dependent receptor [uncultured Aquimarina sp.]
MPKKEYIILLLAYFIILDLYSQELSGTVRDNFGTAISRANVIIRTSDKDSEISEFFISDDNGNFSHTLRKKYSTTVFLEVNALNFDKTVDSIVNPEISKKYVFDFILSPKITPLEEVIISERKKFNVKKDTVTFNLEAYKDGTERKVGDILKKLPGVEVAENGTIKYKGKSVSALQLDGDDLFGYNYAIGTKNISIDMVDQIEAIDNYSENPLLKGIENSDNVALNLKLKKGKVDFSGTGNVGLGYGDKTYYNTGINILGIAKRFKSFGILSYNNIGLSNSPFDYFSASVGLEQLQNENLYSKAVINETPLSSVLNDRRTRVNSEWLANYNFIYRFSPKLSVKTNVYYVKDKFVRQELFQNTFFANNETINYTDQTNITKRPENKRLELKFTYNLSKRSLLELETLINKQNITSRNELIKNFENPGQTELNTEDFLWKNKLQFTNKLGKTSALQFVSLYSRNNKPQGFNTFGDFFSASDVIKSYQQLSEFRKENFQNNLVFLFKRKQIKYALTSGVQHYKTPFESSLKENEMAVTDFQNTFDYFKTNYFSHFSLAYKNKYWKIEPSLAINYLSQKLEAFTTSIRSQKKDVFFLQPNLKTTLYINSVSRIRFEGSYEQKTPEDQYLFSNGIVIDNRSIVNNKVALDLQEHQNYSLGYRWNDIFKNIDINLVAGYNTKNNVYLSAIDVSSNFTSITYFQSPVRLDNWFASLSFERYLRFIKTTFKHSSQYTVSNFKNILNQSDLRSGQSENYNGDIFMKTAFRIPVNFENKISYGVSKFSVENQSNITNITLKNSFKTILKPNKNWLFTFTYDYFKPDTRKSDDFSFLDFNIRYISKKYKWFSASIEGNNLLNNKVFKQIENSDFSTTTYQSNLIPRYFMLSLDVSF